jgi:hypothetical protein
MTPNGLCSLILALALLTLPASAQRRHDGDFAARLVVTDRLDRPTLTAAKSAVRGGVVWGVILFSHVQPTRTDAAARWPTSLLRPDGSVYATNEGAEVPRCRRGARASSSQRSARPAIRPNDPLGRYRISR